MHRFILFSLPFLSLVFTSCLGSTGANESCEDHDRQANAEYIQQYAQDEDVALTESGLHYRVIEDGNGPIPVASDSVEIEFVGRLIDGSIFDTTENLSNPFRFRVKNFDLEGVREGLQLMEEGATYEFVVPSYLGFGETASGEICPGTTLVFDLTLVDVFE